MTPHRLTVYLALSLALGCGNSRSESSTQPVQDPRIPAAQVGRLGVDDAALRALSTRLQSRQCKKIDALLLLQNGEIVFEYYQNGYGPKRPHDIASITKSVTSLLIGIAIDQGAIRSVEDRVVDYFQGTPYEKSWPDDKRAITIENLLTMQHGIACDDLNDPNMERFNKWLQAEDRIADLLQMSTDASPGKRSTYCTASTQLLQQVIERSTGEKVETFAQRVLFDPLGIKSFKWKQSRKHGVAMGFGAMACPRDIAVLGQMVQQQGKWQGKQIVSPRWLQDSFKPRGKLLGIDYGYLWYGEPYKVAGKQIQSHLAMGHGGQFLVLLPELQVTLVITATDYAQEIDFYALIQDFVIPVCSD